MVHLASSGAALPQLVFLLFAGAVWLVKLLSRPKASPAGPLPGPPRAEEAEPDETGDPAAEDPEAEERARRVREEILRKIAERNPSASAGQLRNIVRAAYQRREPVGGAAAPARAPTYAQQALAPAEPPAAPMAAVTPAKSAGAVWLEELRSHDSARRAIVVREILGPPIALR
jgi:hypothetical protein